MMRFEEEESGAHIGYLKIVQDRTAQHLIEERAREGRRGEELRHSLAELSDRLRNISDPAAMQAAAVKVIGQALKADRVGYGTVADDGETTKPFSPPRVCGEGAGSPRCVRAPGLPGTRPTPIHAAQAAPHPYSLREAGVLIESWRRHFNTVRPHSSLGYVPPAPEAVLPRIGTVALWPGAPALDGAHPANPDVALKPVLH